ncbi:MAG TPA: metallophosphoesterase family protein [Bacteroidales bacterium]|nr:metallophosphoesterase family protein [Bacteroidales bacterium]
MKRPLYHISLIAGVLVLVSILLLVLRAPWGGQKGRTMSGTADQVHFSIIDDTSVTFDWTGSADVIEIGIRPGKLNKVIKAQQPSFLPVTSPWKSDPGPYHEARLTGLKKNTVYYYKIGDNQVKEFKTPPLPGTAGFRIVLTTDMHEGSAETLSMFAQIAGLKPDIVLTTGDITGAGPDGQKNVSQRFHDAMAWSQTAAWIPAWGNHDWEYDTIDDLRTYKGRFDIPHPGTISESPAISCCGEDWGWFDYGNTRIISLPEPWESSVRSEWLTQVAPVFEEAQENPQIKFIITFGHRSAYTSTNRRSPGEQSLRTMLDKLHADYPKYKLDLSGHNHQYERYLLPGDMTYVVNVSTGSYYHEGWQTPEKPENCAFRAIHYGILVLDVSENSIDGRLECSAGSTQQGPDYKPLEEMVCKNSGDIIDSFVIEAN